MARTVSKKPGELLLDLDEPASRETRPQDGQDHDRASHQRGKDWGRSGALRAARASAIPTAGWAPRGWLTKDGPAPWLADWGLVECQEGESLAERYRARRRRCIADCEATLLFGDITTPGSCGFTNDFRKLGKRWVWVEPGLFTPRYITEFIREFRIGVRMVGGNRESRQPCIGARVERFLIAVFTSLGAERREA